MKQQRMKFRLLALFLFALMNLLAVYGGYSVITYGSRWFSSRWNTRVTAQRENVIAGDVLDRNGVLLATTVEGERQYQAEAADRRAVVHLLGDSGGRVSNGVESFQTAYLYGFSTPVWELALALLSGEERRGDSLTLTVDSQLCAAAVQSFDDHSATAGKNGAAVVMNYRTGEVLALVSLPGFDPDNVTEADGSDPDQPFLNRATQSLYAPGSAFQIVIAASNLQHLPEEVGGVITSCRGALTIDGHTLQDGGEYATHGQATLAKAFRISCENAFATLALSLGDDRLRTTAENFGFNDNFLFRDLVVENSAYPTGSRSRYELALTGYGESGLRITPVHLCMIAGAVANEGVMMEPRLLKAVTGSGGVRRLSFSSAVCRRAMTADTAAYLATLMKDAVQYGSGAGARVSDLIICGKSGSAENVSGEETLIHGWFAGFCDDEALPFAVTVLVENIGPEESGGTTAALIAGDLFAYLRDHPELVTD